MHENYQNKSFVELNDGNEIFLLIMANWLLNCPKDLPIGDIVVSMSIIVALAGVGSSSPKKLKPQVFTSKMLQSDAILFRPRA